MNVHGSGNPALIHVIVDSLCLVTDLVLSLREVDSRGVVCVDEDLLKSETEEIVGGLLDVLPVLSDELAGGLREDEVDLLEGLVLGLGHEEQLVEPADEGNTAVKACRKTNVGHGLAHCGEVVGNDEGRQEKPAIRGGHAIGA